MSSELELAQMHFEFAKDMHQKECTELEGAKQRVKGLKENVSKIKRKMEDAKERVNKVEMALEVINIDDEEGDGEIPHQNHRKKRKVQQQEEEKESSTESSILARLPDTVKGRFGEVGYVNSVSFGNRWKPVLFLSPFSLDLNQWSGLYGLWMLYYRECIEGSKSWENMPHIVIELAGVPTPHIISSRDTLAYEAGHSRNLHVLSNNIRYKVQMGAPLTSDELARKWDVQTMEKARGMTREQRLEKGVSYMLRRSTNPFLTTF